MSDLLLPAGYKPFRELNLCSILLVNVQVPLLVGGRPALLVGSGPVVPSVWLAAPTNPRSREWAFVVESSQPLRPLITVQTEPAAGIVEVNVGETVVLRARQETEDHGGVDVLDLRPLGLIAYGSAREFHIGGTTMERNRLENLQVAFAIAG